MQPLRSGACAAEQEEKFLEAFWISMGMIFLAELGDKTQLVALTMATRFNARVVLAGVFVATLLVHIVSTALGGCASKLLSPEWIQYLAGLAFIGFGLWTLRGDSLDDDENCNCKGRSPFWIVTCTFFLAELGDKTMLSTVALAANRPFIPVWLGSTTGMVLSDGLAIWVGQALGAKLPERAVKIGAAVIFFGFGIFGMIKSAHQLPMPAWIAGGAAVVLMIFAYLYSTRSARVSNIGQIPLDIEPEAVSEEFAGTSDHK